MKNDFSVAIPEHSVSENTDSEFSTYTSQALPKLPEDNMLDDSEASQVSIYKRLWIEAEASVCKLKYELQVAHMKLATMKGHTNTKTVPIGPSEGYKASRLPVSEGKPHNHAKESSTCAATWQCHQGDSYGSQSPVVNRARTQQSSCVLSAFPVPPPPALVPQPYPVASGTLSGPSCDYCHKLGPTPQQCYKTSESKCEEQQKESEGSYAVEDAVLARLRILKSRADNKTSLGLESSNQQRDASTNKPGEIDDACANMCTRLEVLEPCIDNLSPLDDNKCEEQQKESKGSYSVGDAVFADHTLSFDLESSKQPQLNASTDIADEVDNAVMATCQILKSHPDVKASLIGNAEDVEEDPCVVELQVSSCQSPPLPAAVLEKTTSPSATEPLEVSAEITDILILPSTASTEVPPLSTLKDAPSMMEKDHSGLTEDALPPAPLLSVPQEVGGLPREMAKVKGLSHVPISKCFRLPPPIKIKRPISKQRAQAILLRKLGMIKHDEVDEQAIERCVEVLQGSFPKSLIQAIFCGSDMVKGTPAERWGISASDVVF